MGQWLERNQSQNSPDVGLCVVLTALWAARIKKEERRMAVFAFEAGRTNGPFIRFSLKLPVGCLLMIRMLLGL